MLDPDGLPGRPRSTPLPPERRVALVGSSGGSTQRGSVQTAVSALAAQLAGIGRAHEVDSYADEGCGCAGGAGGRGSGAIDLSFLVFVGCESPLDGAPGRATAALHATASLWCFPDAAPAASGRAAIRMRGELHAVNRLARKADERLAGVIARGDIDALVLVRRLGSTNRASLLAAAAAGLPVVGTGGSSLGEAARMGVSVLEAGGSVGTTPRSRAVAAAAALAAHWRLPYSVQLPPPQLGLGPVLDATLPVTLSLSLWGVAALLLSPAFAAATRSLLALLALPAQLWSGGGAGAVLSPLLGYYHAAVLPLILLEMEGGAFSVLGALDAACLEQKNGCEEGSACRRALAINIWFGDFVEAHSTPACYPYMARDGYARPSEARSSSAYLPIPIATAVCDAPLPFAAACASAFLVPFVGTLLRRMPPLAAWGLLSGLSDTKDAAGPSRRRMSLSRSSSCHSELPFSAAADQRHQH
ncbi:hypothetical protein EMIHUDRAFT_222267 [Emiliania huxleyi CCMP1516]|uniref:Uncharacterized protein n=2 Tax=Emiliania huxleyi TaxID=2903 RepID=A0A0D3KYP6_EMIH1|nr:hypothetical protein EMIHUDRAFT_222267 [Emiliania huxleyi CCMP1516]EOD40881.1 hypothetical protein EMIHUDRAFT_222267 [Emiliania huxleyi CCMP1516]|eukprot:XP_005793310.1 hypothetical protein EMIHUDRAFT_222267 [Emiliania huxleyi CCMP1516]